MTKKFSQTLHDANDPRARRKFQDWLEERFENIKITSNPSGNKYGIDLAVEIVSPWPWTRFYVDVEVREGWEFGEFLYNTIHLPYRKSKFLDFNHPTIFIAFRNDLNKLIMINDYQVKQSRVIEIVNKYSKEPEKFYDIPIKDCLKVNLDGIY